MHTRNLQLYICTVLPKAVTKETLFSIQLVANILFHSIDRLVIITKAIKHAYLTLIFCNCCYSEVNNPRYF